MDKSINVNVSSEDLLIPDVNKAEDGEENPSEEGHWNCQQSCNDTVKPDPGDLEKSVTPDPHPIPAAHRHWLSYHILKTNLSEVNSQESSIITSPSSTL